jgi:hypothetical protein
MGMLLFASAPGGLAAGKASSFSSKRFTIPNERGSCERCTPDCRNGWEVEGSAVRASGGSASRLWPAVRHSSCSEEHRAAICAWQAGADQQAFRVASGLSAVGGRAHRAAGVPR